MKRLLLALLTAFPLFTAVAQTEPAKGNPAIVPADRNKEKGWADRHTAKLAAPERDKAKVIFLGDSITQGWEGSGKAAWKKSFEPLGALNLGYGGDRTEHVLWRLDNGELDGLKAKVLVLLIGTNNIGHHKSNPAQTLEGTKEILARIDKKLPDVKVILMGVFPRAATAEDPLRKGAAEITDLYAKLADGKKITFLSINDKLLLPDGTISKEIMPDLLHLSAKGYDIWAEALEPKVKDLLK